MRRDTKRLRRLILPVLGALGLLLVQSPAEASWSIWDDLDMTDPTQAIAPPGDMDVCTVAGTKRVACVDHRRDIDGNSTAKVCAYDDALRLVMWWYTGMGQVACVESHHWSYLGVPGACVGTGPTGFPTGCVNDDEDRDYDGDGQVDETLHCLVWVAGHAVCFHD